MTCPFPHTGRDKVWLALGLVSGLGVGYLMFKESSSEISSSKAEVQQAPPCVVDIPEKLRIFEHVGGAGNGEKRISVATVTVDTAMDEATQIPQVSAPENLARSKLSIWQSPLSLQ